MALNSYAEVQKFISDVLTKNISSDTNQPEINGMPLSPHKAFWDLPYDQFVNGNVPRVLDPKTNAPMKILVKGDSAHSNLILSLKGAAGTVFDKNDPNAPVGQMPANGPPMFTDPQIQELADWVDKGCPEHAG
jgi:hypothetical protein